MIFIIIITAVSLYGQQVKMFSSAEGGDIVILDEIMGIVTDENGKVQITSLNSKASWPEEYKNLNIELNDEILYVNGTRVKSVEKFKEVYTNIKTDEKVELGIKRGSERFIVSFKRIDTSKLKRKMITMPAGSLGGDNNITVENGKIMLNGKEVDPDSLEKMGINVMRMDSKKKKEKDNN